MYATNAEGVAGKRLGCVRGGGAETERREGAKQRSEWNGGILRYRRVCMVYNFLPLHVYDSES